MVAPTRCSRARERSGRRLEERERRVDDASHLVQPAAEPVSAGGGPLLQESAPLEIRYKPYGGRPVQAGRLDDLTDAQVCPTHREGVEDVYRPCRALSPDRWPLDLTSPAWNSFQNDAPAAESALGGTILRPRSHP